MQLKISAKNINFENPFISSPAEVFGKKGIRTFCDIVPLKERRVNPSPPPPELPEPRVTNYIELGFWQIFFFSALRTWHLLQIWKKIILLCRLLSNHDMCPCIYGSGSFLTNFWKHISANSKPYSKMLFNMSIRSPDGFV